MVNLYDFHAHILPGVDHGCPNIEHALHQLSCAQKAGVTTIVSTSHFYAGRDNVPKLLALRQQAYETLCRTNQTGIRIVLGAEVQIASALSTLPQLTQFSIGDTQHILLEMPNCKWDNWVYNEIEQIQSARGLRVIIAHIDRYPAKETERLLEMDVLFQVNASSLCALRGRHRLLKLIDNGYIQVLGSDVHTECETSYQQFAKSVRILGQARTHRLMQYSQEILHG